ncbi:hypothetical protein ACQY0O_006592 [Thecaphora frezii]
MASKDNANPTIHTTLPSQRPTTNAEWWRDASIHASLQSDPFSLTRSAYDSDDDLPPTSARLAPTTAAASADCTESLGAKLLPPADESEGEKIDSQEVYDLIRSITDPEHPLTLEQLAVVQSSHIVVEHGDPSTQTLPSVLLEFTPTIPHCSMATLIGLSLRVRLLRALPPRYKIDIRVRPGTHQSENAVNKQLNDKERVAAALENAHLLDVVQGCLGSAARRGKSEEEWTRQLRQGKGGSEVWSTVEEVARRLGVQV